MDTERNLLFGVVAFQNGAVDADRLAETCAAWASEPSVTLADHLLDRGLITAEQRTEVEKVVAHELEAHGGDPQATLAATHGRPVVSRPSAMSPVRRLRLMSSSAPPVNSNRKRAHVRLGTIPTHEPESRDRYTLDASSRQRGNGPRLARP